MKITLRRTGGFGNLVVNKVVDSTTLVQSKVTELQQMVTKLIPFTQEKVEAAPDVCHYDLKVEEDNGQKYELEANDLTVTDDMQSLFDFLMDEG